jgi:hypothetical protein
MGGADRISDNDDIANTFNIHFTSISSGSLANHVDCTRFIFDFFKQAKSSSTFNTPGFNFSCVSEDLVEHMFDKLALSCSPGSTDIPMKVLKASSHIIISHITHLFNCCIANGVFPDDWKVALVTPLFKNKGLQSGVNYYRGISILPIFAKWFEKIMAFQIYEYFENNQLLFDGQHGFRKNFSCETALHELISDTLSQS